MQAQITAAFTGKPSVKSIRQYSVAYAMRTFTVDKRIVKANTVDYN